MFAMLVPVLLIFIWRAEGAYRCSDNSKNGNQSMSFTRSLDGVRGRYTAELCTPSDPRVTEWKVDLGLYDPTYCSASNTNMRAKPDAAHSTNTVPIADHTNCTRVCYSMDFDLIFSSCYGIQSTLLIKGIGRKPFITFHNVSNNLTEEHFSGNKPHAIYVNHDNEVSIIWYLGIPATVYDVEIFNKTKGTQVQDVTGNCSLGARPEEVRCGLALPYGAYDVALVHQGPWVSGLLTKQQRVVYEFEHLAAAAPRVSGTARGALWACGATVLVAGAALAALLAVRALRRRAHYKQVFEHWRRHRQEAAPAGEAGAAGPVLLLYAREGERGQRAADTLRALLQDVVQGPVFDLYAPETVARWATSPVEWLRGVLAAPDARVVLLQSPALALHLQQLDQAQDKVLGPLLGRRAMYRQPAPGDAQLQLALRLVAAAPADPAAYRKYFVAEFTGLAGELVPALVPFRRYALPALAEPLLRDVGGAGARPAPGLLRAHADAALAFVRHVRAAPDYLVDELHLV